MRGEEDGGTFTELLKRVREGNRQALDELFARFGEQEADAAVLRAIARKVLAEFSAARDIYETQDVTQSTLRTGLVDLGDFRGETPAEFFGWLRTICRRKVSRALQRKRPGRLPGMADDDGFAAPRRETDDPLAEAQRRETRARFLAAIRELPEDQRAVIALRLKGLKAPAIATQLGLTPETVRKRESRARERLRHVMGENSLS